MSVLVPPSPVYSTDQSTSSSSSFSSESTPPHFDPINATSATCSDSALLHVLHTDQVAAIIPTSYGDMHVFHELQCAINQYGSPHVLNQMETQAIRH